MSPARKERVALVGCGAISRAHAAAIAADPGLELVAVVDSDAGALRCAGEEYGVEAFESVEALLDRNDARIACVCTPPATHRRLAERLLRGGLDVLCEKPLAISVEDAEAMARTADETGRRLFVSDKFRHVDDLREAGERLRAGDVGEPITYAVSFCAPVDVRGRWPSNPALSGGGVVMDNAPHAFDVLSHVLDEPIVHVDCWRAQPVLAPPVEDTAALRLRTASGRLGLVELSWVYFAKDLDYLVVQGTEGTIRVGWTGGSHRRHGDRDWTSFGSGYDKERAFSAMWRSFRSPEETAGRAPGPIEVLRLIEDAYEGAAASAGGRA